MSIPTTVYLPLFGKTDQGDMPGPLDGGRQFALMSKTVAGDSAGNDAPPLRQKIPQEADILKIY